MANTQLTFLKESLYSRLFNLTENVASLLDTFDEACVVRDELESLQAEAQRLVEIHRRELELKEQAEAPFFSNLYMHDAKELNNE